MQTDKEIFDGEEPEVETKVEPEVETEEKPTGEEQAAAPEKEAAKAEDESPDESSPDSEKSTVPITALHGERDRRKAAEDRARELEEQLKSKKTDPTSVFEDENKFRDEIMSEIRNERLRDRLELSEKFARKFHGNEVVDEAMDWFIPAAKESPLLQQKFNEAGNDVDKVVELYKAHLEAEKLEDIDAVKAKLKEEAKAEVLKELEAKNSEKSKLRDSIPESLAGDASAGGLSSQQFHQPSDEELFDNQ